MLIQNENLIPLLLSSLILEPDHIRQGMPKKPKAGIQADGSECFQQLAVFKRGRELLLQHEALVFKALEAVAESGLSSEAQGCARGALIALRGVESMPASPIGAKHVMLSYQWSSQPTIIRINESLQRRGYATWLDIEHMKGSIMDCMSLAIEGAQVMLYLLHSKTLSATDQLCIETLYSFGCSSSN